MKKISIIIPVYNTEKFLKRCVESVLAQTYKNIEVILVDDGSTDNSPKMCDSFVEQDDRVRVVHKQNGGLSSARNAGLDIATGEYIGFIDSDDYISPKMYEVLVDSISDSSSTVSNIIIGRVNEKGEIWDNKLKKESKVLFAEEYVKELMLHKGDVSVCSKLFPKETIGELRFCEGVLNEDLLFMLDAIKRIDRINFINHIGYFYYTRADSTSHKFGKAFMDMVSNSLIAQEKANQMFPSLKEETFRFVMYQHMAYLLAVPLEDANKDNAFYKKTLAFLRKNTLKVFSNKYLNVKNKIIILFLAVVPHLTARAYQRKQTARKN